MKPMYILLLVALAAFSCRYRQLKEPLPAVHEIEAGEKFRITVPENHTNGEWSTLHDNYDPKVVERLNEVWHGDEKGIDFNFRAKELGTSTLTIIRKRFQETLDTVNFSVKITQN